MVAPRLEDLDLCDVADVQRIVKVGANTAYQLMWDAGPIKVGHSLRVRRGDLDAHLERLRVRSAT